jgi:hypothetical protein
MFTSISASLVPRKQDLQRIASNLVDASAATEESKLETSTGSSAEPADKACARLATNFTSVQEPICSYVLR